MEERHENILEASQLWGFSRATIRRWIKVGKLEATKTTKGYQLPLSDKNRDFLWKEYRKRSDKILHTPYNPEELSEYTDWHDILDELAWLFKVCYSADWNVKSKRFRTEFIFVNYLKAHNITLKKIKTVFAANQAHSSSAIEADLKRGWYNELAYAVPLRKSTLGLGFSDINLNSAVSNSRFAFPSWRVIIAYYAVYFYLRAMTLQKFKNFRLEEHRATIISFKSSLLRPLSKVIWKFPLDIIYAPGQRVYRKQLYINKINHLKYAYAKHPRTPHLNASSLFEHIYKTYRTKARASSKPTSYMIFDFLHDFRVWANYQNIDDLLSLWGKGYKAFIDQNLFLLLFFIGGITELCYIAVFGPQKYLENLQKLYDLFAINNPQLEKDFENTPLFQRCEIFKELGFIDETIKLKVEFDVNTVIFLSDA